VGRHALAFAFRVKGIHGGRPGDLSSVVDDGKGPQRIMQGRGLGIVRELVEFLEGSLDQD